MYDNWSISDFQYDIYIYIYIYLFIYILHIYTKKIVYCRVINNKHLVESENICHESMTMKKYQILCNVTKF